MVGSARRTIPAGFTHGPGSASAKADRGGATHPTSTNTAAATTTARQTAATPTAEDPPEADRRFEKHPDYPGPMLDLSNLDLEEIATALADQPDYEHRWLIDPRTGEVAFWTSDLGIDGQNPVDLDDLDLICIDPLPSYVWYQDMADFAERISDHRAGQRLARAIEGRGAFRPFEDELHQGPAGGVVRLPRRPRPTPCRRLARR